MTNSLTNKLVGFVFIFAALTASATTVTYDFNSTLLPPSLTIDNTGSDYSLTLSGSQAILQQASGSADGWITVTSSFVLSGDFIVSIDAYRSGLQAAQAGLGMSFGSDVFYVGTSKINANIGPYPAAWGFSVPDSTTQFATFKLVRTGDTVSAYYNNGSGDVFLGSNSDPSLAVDAKANFFLIQAAGGTGPESTALDNFTLTSVPEPSTLMLLGGGLAGCAGLVRRKLYR
ncbi:MAG TPA: PEP-CTERM sorting domain-containing protein [Terriglobales bacterium]|nr:PEP-CTERM sorting domain-containing protein [Terriglobales bacterium]